MSRGSYGTISLGMLARASRQLRREPSLIERDQGTIQFVSSIDKTDTTSKIPATRRTARLRRLRRYVFSGLQHCTSRHGGYDAQLRGELVLHCTE